MSGHSDTVICAFLMDVRGCSRSSSLLPIQPVMASKPPAWKMGPSSGHLNNLVRVFTERWQSQVHRQGVHPRMNNTCGRFRNVPGGMEVQIHHTQAEWMSWHFKYPPRRNVLNEQNCCDSWLGGGGGEGAAGDGGRDEDCFPEMVSLSEQRSETNPAWPRAPRRHVWCLHAFISCLRCLKRLWTVRKGGC